MPALKLLQVYRLVHQWHSLSRPSKVHATIAIFHQDSGQDEGVHGSRGSVSAGQPLL